MTMSQAGSRVVCVCIDHDVDHDGAV